MLSSMRNTSALVFSSIFMVTGLAACEDPAKDATAAQVESAAEPTAPAPTDSERESLTIDPARSSVGFTGAKVTDSHDGTFETFTGTIQLDPEDFTKSSVEVTIQIDSLDTEPADLQAHLLSPDLFDAAQFPTSTFETTTIASGGEGGTHTITGNLTLHGQTRSITFPANVEITDAEVRARAEFSINRKDFGIVYPGMPDDLIRDGVVIRFDVRAPRQS